MKQPRVVIAEDFVLIQEMIRDIIEPSCEVVAMVMDGGAALDAANTHRPDIVLLDASLPLLSGFAVAEKLATTLPETKIMFVTAHADPTYIARAFEIGAKAYLLKSSIRTELMPAISAILSGNVYLSAILRS